MRTPYPSASGNARGDLQYRLSEATRTLAQTVEGRYADATGRMREALRAAEEIGAGSAAESAEKENLLSERITATRHALALLDSVEPGLSGFPAPRPPAAQERAAPAGIPERDPGPPHEAADG